MWIKSVLTLGTLCLTSAELTNRKVTRKINLDKHYTRIETTVTIHNGFDSPKSRIKLMPDPLLQDKLSTFFVKSNGKAIWLDPASWEAQLPNALAADGTVDLNLEEIYTHTTVPFPEKIKQNNDQGMKYQGNLHHFSPYTTRRASVSVILPSTKIYSFTPGKDAGAKVNSKTVDYDVFKDVEANKIEKMDFHYQANIPYVTTHYLMRQIEVSHWGAVVIKDNADVRHVGAELDGSFSRIQYAQDGGDANKNSHWVPSLTAKLPADAENINYRDAIGHISTSREKKHKKHVEVECRPRTPLFGGWKSDYTLGFNLPSEKALFYDAKDSSRFTLKLKAVDELYKDQVIDDLEIQVILPEGAVDIDVKIPAGYDRAHDEVIFSYLDMLTGRPVIKLRAKNLSGKSLDQNLQVSYTFARMSILREPLMTIAFFMIFFIFVMFIVRLDFTIGDDGSSDTKERLNAAYMLAHESNRKRVVAQAAYEKALSRYKETSDMNLLSSAQKGLKAEMKAFQRVISDVSQDHSEVLNEKWASINDLGNSYNEAVQSGEKGLKSVKDLDVKISALVEN